MDTDNTEQQTDEQTDEQMVAVQSFIKDQVQTYFNELKEAEPQKQQIPHQPQQQTEQDLARQQMQEALDPFITPQLNKAQLEAADGKDYVRFYTNNPEGMEYQEQVEKTFEALKEAGRPTSRQDIYKYILGQEYSTDKDKFIEKQVEKRKQSVQRASEASDFGASALDRARNDPVFSNFESRSIEEMEQALEGVTF